MDPDNEENNILDLEEGSSDDTGIDVADFSEGGIGSQSIGSIIAYYLQQAAYEYDIAKINEKGTSVDANTQTFNLNQIFQNADLRGIFSDETIALYNDVTTNLNIDKLTELVIKADAEIRSAEPVIDRPTEGSVKGATSYVFQKPGFFGQGTQTNTQDIIDEINKTLNSVDYTSARETEERLQKQSDAGEYIPDPAGTYRSTHPAWGYTTDKDGMVQSKTETDPTTGEPTEYDAPFPKGAEYRNFIDMDPSEIFILKQRMVRAGHDAGPPAEFGQWTDKDAAFMAQIFIKATDTGNWEKDMAAGIAMYETTLTEQEAVYNETKNFSEMYQDFINLEQQVKANPTQIKELMDQVGALMGINFTDADYVDFAEDINKSLAEASASQKAYEDSLITDRDIILGTTLGDSYRAEPGEGYVKLALPNSRLPLIVPGYEVLMQGKGEIPQPKSAIDTIQENLLARPEIQGEIASVENLQQIQYGTNFFEASMGQIGMGDDT
jgi:hypothetical protein